MVTVITRVFIISLGGFIIYKIVRGVAAFVDALQGVPDPPREDEHLEEHRWRVNEEPLREPG